MFKRKYKSYRILGISLFILIYFFVDWIFNCITKKTKVGVSRYPEIKYKKGNISTVMLFNIERKLQEMKFTPTTGYREVLKNLTDELRFVETLPPLDAWSLARKWITPRQTIPDYFPELGSILNAMATSPIVYAGHLIKGTQNKVLILLQGNQTALFKPKWYSRDYVEQGPPYAGMDRHNGEIASFHLCRILGMNRCPLVVGRRVKLETELHRVANPPMARTFFTEGPNICFFGVCNRCNRSTPVCGDGEILEGAIILFFPPTMTLDRMYNPWKRIYNLITMEWWERDPNYCQTVPITGQSMMLDAVDISVFDYLIGNADRFYYESFSDVKNASILLVDNGKSFGNPYWDEVSILAPLYQCCRIRQKTVDRLELFVDNLGASLEEILTFDPLSPILTKPHLEALDRRLKAVLAAIAICIEKEIYAHKVIISGGIEELGSNKTIL